LHKNYLGGQKVDQNVNLWLDYILTTKTFVISLIYIHVYASGRSGFCTITISINCRMSTFHLYYCIPTNASNLT